jgi:short subunit dehydrogenase-like uncharacterized protein
MRRNIMLYGATGYSGRLIAGELARLVEADPSVYRVVLAGRDAERLKSLSAQFGMEYCVFGLQDASAMANALHGADVVVNAAGPCAWTAPKLAGAALKAGCHYVDINGETDVYSQLRRDRGRLAYDRRLAIVCGAGFWAAASNLLLDRALTTLSGAHSSTHELGAIRIAMSRIQTFSRGSAATVWRSLRQQVVVVRKGRIGPTGKEELMVQWREPVGKLERNFDFSAPGSPKADRRIASAASLVDTLAAQLVAVRHHAMVETIESYVETDAAARAAYKIGSVFSPLAAVPALRAIALQPVALLAEGPTQEERDNEPHVILLEIEDRYRKRIVDWRWETPNVYQFTAQLVTVVAAQLLARPLKGWLTPAAVLEPLLLPLTSATGATRGCKLHERST